VKEAAHPFQFVTASYVTRICNQRAGNLRALRAGLKRCSAASIFYHTFHSLGRLHFIPRGFSNDFAEWALTACNQPQLAEQLASLDVRDYLSLTHLRGNLWDLVNSYCLANPREARQPAFETLYFCESIEVDVPLEKQACTLKEFREAIAGLSHAAFHFHFITSRLRLRLRSNDFSVWLASELGLEVLARRINRLDIYTATLDGVRQQVIDQLDLEIGA